MSMSLLRDDLTFEANEARRKFWEMCASREPVHYAVEVTVDRDGEQTHYLKKEDEDDIARWADNMLDEWDKRWIESQETRRAVFTPINDKETDK